MILKLSLRRQFLRQRASAIIIQKYWRGHKGRKIFKMVNYRSQPSRCCLVQKNKQTHTKKD